MTTWHIAITFQAPPGADITDDIVTELHEALPAVSTVSRTPDNHLEFMLHADSLDSVDLYATVYRRLANACTNVLGFPVEFLHSEVAKFDYWLDQIDPDGKVRAWSEQGRPTSLLPDVGRTTTRPGVTCGNINSHKLPCAPTGLSPPRSYLQGVMK